MCAKNLLRSRACWLCVRHQGQLPEPLFRSGEEVMVMIAEALAAERERRKRETEETATQREVGRAVLQALLQRLTASSVPNWHFMLSDDEVSVLRIKAANARERVGSWVVDPEMKLVFGPHTTEWITAES